MRKAKSPTTALSSPRLTSPANVAEIATAATSCATAVFLKSLGLLALDTVRRRLANWSTLTKWRGLSGAFASPALKSARRLGVRAVPRPRRRKSAKAVTGDVLAKLLATCDGDSLRDIRDRAILTLAFASGDRPRSEVAGLRKEQLAVEPPVTGEDNIPSPRLPSVSAARKHPARAKTRSSFSPSGRWTR